MREADSSLEMAFEGVSWRPELKTKESEGVCDRGGEVIFCSVVSFQKGLGGRSCWVTGGVGDNR